MLFDSKHRVLLVKFARALTRQALEAMVLAAREFVAVMAGARRILVAPDDEMFGVARLYGLHQSTSQGEEPMVVRTLQAAYDLLDLKDPDFQPFEIGSRSPE